MILLWIWQFIEIVRYRKVVKSYLREIPGHGAEPQLVFTGFCMLDLNALNI